MSSERRGIRSILVQDVSRPPTYYIVIKCSFVSVNCVETLSIPKMSRDAKTVTCFSLGGCEGGEDLVMLRLCLNSPSPPKDLILRSREFLHEPLDPMR